MFKPIIMFYHALSAEKNQIIIWQKLFWESGNFRSIFKLKFSSSLLSRKWIIIKCFMLSLNFCIKCSLRNAIVEFSFYETAFVHEISVINEPAMLGTIINSLFKSPTVLFWHNINISISKISFYISFFN